jgi:predicted metal-dependent phosphoesterase TrpH
LIDLHMHTTASDGRLTPAALVERAAAAGLTTIAVTDHDTASSIDEVTRLASAHGIRTVPGIEITSVDDGRDVHMLGYFLDHHSAPLLAFLDAQRRLRAARIAEMGRRLAAMGLPVDVDGLLARAAAVPGTSIGRPWLARALVAAGHVGSVAEAFERYLAAGQPAFVPRTGSSPGDVIAVVHAAGGIASFAHPGVTRRDWLLEPLVEAGLDAIEVYHSDHDADARRTYQSHAQALGVATSGGSDFHGYGETRAALGLVTLPADEFAALEARAAARPGTLKIG